MPERAYKFSFFTYTFLNVDNLINFVHRQLKLSMAILDINMEGSVSQIFHIGEIGMLFILNNSTFLYFWETLRLSRNQLVGFLFDVEYWGKPVN